ncbi:geranylgeranyl pyrophosphate synthase [Lactiplantibacillus fabifermentans T30PCM01]|uniref:Trans-hexaprenyltranstransferase, component ii n=3 Tax=Lactiplantibacillus fabifermentans TaxID=483011 RepID=A0A0R2NLT6_9LACO|nr:geranylgeranyl pyrophosphate synthase [Lactiplantibacillus fabifermentans T30PCM01]KRO26713.1 trans-hexaprenyltranstransferase, component ii [Lactiplantibacillus fabifermentans DSM 21115]
MQATQLHPLWHDYPALQPELQQVMQLMEDNINIADTAITDAILAMIHSGGKLLRPAYCLLFSQFKDTDRQRMIALAASLETLHTATLIHDDILDDAKLRRHQVTIQEQFGKDVAVYAGDYLFVVVFKILAKYSSSFRSIQLNSENMEKILIGEVQQKDRHYHLDMTMDQYKEQIQGKTAELFALSCFLGAYESGQSERFAVRARNAGMAIGMAFQILDDILDYQETSHEIGKPILEDVAEGVYTSPLLFALQTDVRQDLLPLLRLQGNITSQQREQVQALVIEAGGVDQAKQLATDYTNQALKLLKKFPDTPARAMLLQLTQQLLTRHN